MNNKNKELPTETVALLAKRYEGLPKRTQRMVKSTLEKLSKDYTYFGLSPEEIMFTYFNALDYYTEATREKRNIQDDWIRLIFENYILMQVLITRGEAALEEIRNKILDKADFLYNPTFES